MLIERLGDLLEERSDWVVVTAGIGAALLFYVIIRSFIGAFSYLSRPYVPRSRRRGFSFMIGRLLFRSHDDTCFDMDALSNTPDEDLGVGAEKRAAFRRRDTVVEIRVVAPEFGQHEPERAFVVDRSTTGLGIIIKKAFSIGSVISIRPVAAPDDVPWIEVEVRSCKPQKNHFRLGCQFVVVPDWNILLQFG
jgi:hypothetical protein